MAIAEHLPTCYGGPRTFSTEKEAESEKQVRILQRYEQLQYFLYISREATITALSNQT